MPLLKLLTEDINNKLQKYIDRVSELDTFKKWFKDSKVVNEAGDPLIVFHSSETTFDEFRKGDLGFHFGTSKAAKDRIMRARVITDPDSTTKDIHNAIYPEMEEFEQDDFTEFLENLQQELGLSDVQINNIGADLSGVREYLEELGLGEDMTQEEFESYLANAFAQQTSPDTRDILNFNIAVKGSNTGAYFLSIQNPIMDVHDIGEWDEFGEVQYELAGYVEDINGVDMDEWDVLSDMVDIREYLLNLGIDGIQYTNTYEDSGSESWIAFKPEQIKSIWNKGDFNPTSKKFNEGER